MLPKFTKKIHFGWWVSASMLFIMVTGFLVPSVLGNAEESAKVYFDARNALSLHAPQLELLRDAVAAMPISASVFLSVDLAFPLAYNFYFFTSLIVVLRKQTHPQIKYLLWLPLITLLADVSQQVLLRLYLQEAELAFLSKWIPLFTQWKWVCIYGTFSVLIVAFGYKFIAFQKAKLFGETM